MSLTLIWSGTETAAEEEVSITRRARKRADYLEYFASKAHICEARRRDWVVKEKSRMDVVESRR